MADERKKSGIFKWLLLLGCGGLFVLGVCGGLFTVGIFSGIRAMMQSSRSYPIAMQALEESPEAQRALGSPIEVGTFFSGSMNSSNGDETSNFSFPVSGPNGEGKVYVESRCRPADECQFDRLDLVVGGQTIDLLE